MIIWKDIPGFEDCYEISSNGQLRSKERYVKHWRGTLRKYKARLKKLRYDKSGYLRCNLKKDGRRFDFRVSRLVAMAFLPNPENKPEVNHINGIKDDNRLENLEWCTRSENRIHAVKTRLIKTMLSDKQAKEIHSSKKPQRTLAKEYGVNHSIIWRIKNERAYKHLW